MTRAFVGISLTSVILASCSSGPGGDAGAFPSPELSQTSTVEHDPEQEGTGPETPKGPSGSRPKPTEASDATRSTTTASGAETDFGRADGTTLPSGRIRLQAIVGTIDTADARILLKEPVSGYSMIATTEATEFRLSEGEAASFADVDAGSPISATGAAGNEQGVLVAELVVLLDA